MTPSPKSLRSQIENGQHAIGGERVMLPTETVLGLLDEVDRLAAILKAQDERVGPKVGDDPVAVALRWNGHSGTTEPDFDMNPEDTASLLASAVIELRSLLSTRDAEIAGMRKENERLQAVVEAAENVVAENSTRINHARASKAMVNLYHLIASMPNVAFEGSSAWRSGISASLRCVRYRQSVMPDLQTPAYKQALADVALHLMAMLERNSEKSTTQLAAIDALAPATKEG